MSKKLVLLVFLILFSTIASADYWSYLTKGLADTLYCKLTGCRMEGDINMGNHSIINATWVNMTYINAEEIVGLADKIDNDTIIRNGNITWITKNQNTNSTADIGIASENTTIFRTNKGGTINAGVNITKNLNITQ